MPNIKTIYAVVGEGEGDDYIWGIGAWPGIALVFSPDAPTRHSFDQRIGMIKAHADKLATLTGKKYKICKYVLKED